MILHIHTVTIARSGMQCIDELPEHCRPSYSSHAFFPLEASIRSSWHLQLLRPKGKPENQVFKFCYSSIHRLANYKSISVSKENHFKPWKGNLMHKFLRNTPDIHTCTAKAPRGSYRSWCDKICNSNLKVPSVTPNSAAVFETYPNSKRRCFL